MDYQVHQGHRDSSVPLGLQDQLELKDSREVSVLRDRPVALGPRDKMERLEDPE